MRSAVVGRQVGGSAEVAEKCIFVSILCSPITAAIPSPPPTATTASSTPSKSRSFQCQHRTKCTVGARQNARRRCCKRDHTKQIRAELQRQHHRARGDSARKFTTPERRRRVGFNVSEAVDTSSHQRKGLEDFATPFAASTPVRRLKRAPQTRRDRCSWYRVHLCYFLSSDWNPAGSAFTLNSL